MSQIAWRSLSVVLSLKLDTSPPTLTMIRAGRRVIVKRLEHCVDTWKSHSMVNLALNDEDLKMA